MNDPWQQESLEALVAYVEAAKEAGEPAWALVVASSERLEGQVLGEFGAHMDTVEELRLCCYFGDEPALNARDALAARLDEPLRDEFVVTFITGLFRITREEEEDRDEADQILPSHELLTWLNFNRERFERPGEAFIFLVPPHLARRWTREAPDLDRYVQRFEFFDWDDMIEEARQPGRVHGVVSMPGSAPPGSLQHRLERARALGDDELVFRELGTAYGMAISAGDEKRAEEIVEEIAPRVDASEPDHAQPFVILAHWHNRRGRPDLALSTLSSLPLEGWMTSPVARADALFHNGEVRRALHELDAHPPRAQDLQDFRIALSTMARPWMGEISRILEFVAEPEPFSTSGWASAVLATEQGRASEVLTEIVWGTAIIEMSNFPPAVDGYILLSKVLLEVGHVARAIQALHRATTCPGGLSATAVGRLPLQAEARWTLDGPTSLSDLIRAETERQRGWTAPIPAAELAYARGLAATTDDAARRHLADASDRYRAMEGWYYISEVERWLARLDRLHGDLDRAQARIEEGLAWHIREGTRPREARDRTELSLIALGRGQPDLARDQAHQALDLIHGGDTRLYEPAAVLALAAAERALGHTATADAHDTRWRRLVRGISARGLEAALERDAAWAAARRSPARPTPGT